MFYEAMVRILVCMLYFTQEEPNPEPVPAPRVKAELKPLIEELRKIDS